VAAQRTPTTDPEAGSGLLSTIFGVGVVIAFFFFAAQLSLQLYAKSMATAIAQDFARDVALLGPPATRDQAKVEDLHHDAESRLSGIDGHLDIVTADCSPETVCVHLTATPPNLVANAPGVTIDRVLRVRIEQVVQ
jgi:hypothetical protein